MANAMETRVKNILSVIRSIHGQPGISKPQLCKECGLTPSTVQGIVSLLSENGVVTGLDSSDSTGGRKAQRYTINQEYKIIIGVSIRIQRVDIGILDLNLNLLHQTNRLVTLSSIGPESYVANLIQDIKQILIDFDIPYERIAGIGVSVPGPTDFVSGIVREMSGAPLWCDFPLGSRISSVLKLPVWVDKDAYMGIQYLDYSRQIEKDRTTVYLTICEGIGAALMADNKIFRGAHSLAGEIGHVTVRPDGVRCYCGNTGCLELYCSDIGIVTQYNTQSDQGYRDVDEIILKAEEGDVLAQRIFGQAVRYLVDTTNNIIMNYDPDEIVIYCRWLNQQKSLYFKLLDGLYAKSIFTNKHTVNIRLLESADIYLHSAAAIVGAKFLFSTDSPLIAALEQ